MKILTIANQKGGVGKSALTCQLAHYLTAQKYSVLVIDFDHQCHTSKALKLHNNTYVGFNSFELLCNSDLSGSISTFLSKVIRAEIILPLPFIGLIPGSQNLNMLERIPNEHNNYIENIKIFCEQVKGCFDICLIDTNPNQDIRYISALSISDYVLSPIQMNQESIDGLIDFFNHRYYGFNNIKDKINSELSFLGVLPSMVQSTLLQKENFIEVKKELSKYLIKTKSREVAYIPFSSAIAEAQQKGIYVADIKKSAARKAFKITKAAFAAIEKRLNLGVKNGVKI